MTANDVAFINVVVTPEDIEGRPGDDPDNPCLRALRRVYGSSWRKARIHDIVLELEAPYRAIILPAQAIEAMRLHTLKHPTRPFEFVAQLYSSSSFVKLL